MKFSCKQKSKADRSIKYDYLGAIYQALRINNGGHSFENQLESLIKIAEHGKGTCWDYARARKLILREEIGLPIWTASYTSSIKGAPHVFLIVAGWAYMDPNEDYWKPVPLNLNEIETHTKAAREKKENIVHCLIVDDPYYHAEPYFPCDSKKNLERIASNLKDWYVMEEDYLNRNAKKNQCAANGTILLKTEESNQEKITCLY